MRTRTTAMVALAAIALSLLAPVAASAQTGTEVRGLSAVQDAAAAAIDRRLETLDRVHDVVTSNPHVSGEHRGALLGEIGDHRGGLSALRAAILATDDPAELRELLPSIATDFRIYLVFVPKATGVLASDAALSITDRVETEVVPRFEEWIDRIAAAGGDVTEAEAYLVELEESLVEIATLAAGIGTSLLPLEAADWEDPARGVIEQAKADGEAAKEAAKAAGEAARGLIEALRSAAA